MEAVEEVEIVLEGGRRKGRGKDGGRDEGEGSGGYGV